MKRALVTAIFAVFISISPNANGVCADSAEKCILIHPDTGAVLYEKNADEPSLIASTTKIMTALVVLENCDINESVVIKPEWTGIEGSSMYLKAGESYTIRQLLYGLMLASGNDAATALAGYVSGSNEAFARLMNEKARALGLENTNFKNPHGLDAEGHFSSAHDLAIIMAKAMENPDFAEIGSARSVDIGELTFVNHNKLLWQYDGTLGGKTGYTMASGRTLVTCAEREGLRLICVTLSDPDDWNTHTALYDWAFQNYVYSSVRPIWSEIELPLISGMQESLRVDCRDEDMALLPRDHSHTLTIELPSFVYAPVKFGETLGRITVRVDGKELCWVPLKSAQQAERDNTLKLTPWERFRLSWYKTPKLGAYCPAFRSVLY